MGLILWGLAAIFILIMFINSILKLENVKDQFIVALIFVLAAPFLIGAFCFTYILDIFLPEGWENEWDNF